MTTAANGTNGTNGTNQDDGSNSRLVALLEAIGLPTGKASNDTKALSPGDEEFQVLKAGVTEATAWVAKVIAGAGGIGTVLAAVGAYLAKQNSGMQIVLVASAAGILATAAVSLSVVIGADLRARAHASAAQYHALGQVAAAYEEAQGSGTAQPAPQASQNTSSGTLPDVLSSELSISLLAVAVSGRQVRARIKQTDESLYITGIRYESGNLRVRMSPAATDAAGSWHDLDEIDEFNTTVVPGRGQGSTQT
jgi:hypothetical protein